jgi:hypothetical protein
MTDLADWRVAGCLERAAWQAASGALGVFVVWESVEAFRSFRQDLMPIFGEVGLPGRSRRSSSYMTWSSPSAPALPGRRCGLSAAHASRLGGDASTSLQALLSIAMPSGPGQT